MSTPERGSTIVRTRKRRLKPEATTELVDTPEARIARLAAFRATLTDRKRIRGVDALISILRQMLEE